MGRATTPTWAKSELHHLEHNAFRLLATLTLFCNDQAFPNSAQQDDVLRPTEVAEVVAVTPAAAILHGVD